MANNNAGALVLFGGGNAPGDSNDEQERRGKMVNIMKYVLGDSDTRLEILNGLVKQMSLVSTLYALLIAVTSEIDDNVFVREAIAENGAEIELTIREIESIVHTHDLARVKEIRRGWSHGLGTPYCKTRDGDKLEQYANNRLTSKDWTVQQNIDELRDGMLAMRNVAEGLLIDLQGRFNAKIVV